MTAPTARTLRTGLLGGAALVAGLTLLSRVAGFGRTLVFSPTVGSTCVGSAYLTANQLPNVLFEVVAGGALAGAVVPLLAGPLARGDAAGREEADRTASALLTWAVTVLVPVAVLLALLSGPLVRALLGGPDCAGQAALAQRLLLVFAPQVVLYGVGVVLTGVLQAHRRFAAPALAPLASSVVVLSSYLLYAQLAGPDRGDPARVAPAAEAVLAWGTTAGVAALTLPLAVPAARAGVRLHPTWSFPPGAARRAVRLASAGLVALVAQQVSVVALTRSANAHGGGEGALAVQGYAQAVYLLPHAVLVVPLATVAFPRLAAAAATGDRGGYARTAAATTRAVVLVATAGAAALVAAAPAVGAFFTAVDAGGGPGAVLPALGPTLAAMAPGLLGLALVAHAGRALYALERGRSAAAATAAGWLVVAIVAVLGAAAAPDRGSAVVALGVANTAGMGLAAVLLLLALARAAGPAALAGVPRTLGVALAGALGGATAGAVLGRALLHGPLAASDPTGAAAATSAGAAGVVAGAVAVAVVGAAVALGDPGSARTATALVRRRTVAVPPAAPQEQAR